MEFVNDWQLLIKTARIRDRKYRRRGYTFEAKNIGVNYLNVAIAECKSHPLAGQEAIVVAVMRAKERGFSKLIVLTNSKSTEKI